MSAGPEIGITRRGSNPRSSPPNVSAGSGRHSILILIANQPFFRNLDRQERSIENQIPDMSMADVDRRVPFAQPPAPERKVVVHVLVAIKFHTACRPRRPRECRQRLARITAG